jgi:indole-3-acetate monooxygenase
METTHDDRRFVRSARLLTSQIEAAGPANDRDRRLQPDIVRALADAGLFHMLLPRSIGGGELSLPSCLEVLEAVAQADGSTGWCLGQNSMSASQVAPYLDHAVLRAIFSQADGTGAILSNGTGGNGRAVAVDGGYRLSGSWSFASGVMHATWVKAACPAYDAAGEPIRLPDGTHRQMTMLLPRAQATIVDDWFVGGLRGTGSNTIKVEDVFIPRQHAVSLSHDPKHERGPLYAVPWIAFACSGFSSVALGIARGALNAFIALASDKTPRALRSTLRENAVIQAQVAQCEARLRAARAFLFEQAHAMWTIVERGEDLPRDVRALLRLAATSGSHTAADVVRTVYHAAGATAVFESNAFERRFRDVHAVTQQIQSSQHHFETVGQFFLGLDPETPYF